jgi:hypothetical protein
MTDSSYEFQIFSGMNILKKLFLCLCLCFFFSAAQAQLGHYLNIWGGPQYTALANTDDYDLGNTGAISTISALSRTNTYRAGFGVDYIYNFATSYGIQTGLYYSQNGQSYSGIVYPDYNQLFNQLPRKSVRVDFKSHVYMNYLRIPFMLRFSSQSEPDDRLNMSIFFGFTYGRLLNVQEVYTNPAPADSLVNRYPNFDFKKLYNNSDFLLGAGMEMNVRLTSHFGIFIGARFDRSLSGVENLGYAVPADAPVEWDFPVSAKKTTITDRTVRQPTKNNTINVFFGVSFKLAGAPEPMHRPMEPEAPATEEPAQ